jgi:hypothetical protein
MTTEETIATVGDPNEIDIDDDLEEDEDSHHHHCEELDGKSDPNEIAIDMVDDAFDDETNI